MRISPSATSVVGPPVVTHGGMGPLTGSHMPSTTPHLKPAQYQYPPGRAPHAQGSQPSLQTTSTTLRPNSMHLGNATARPSNALHVPKVGDTEGGLKSPLQNHHPILPGGSLSPPNSDTAAAGANAANIHGPKPRSNSLQPPMSNASLAPPHAPVHSQTGNPTAIAARREPVQGDHSNGMRRPVEAGRVHNQPGRPGGPGGINHNSQPHMPLYEPTLQHNANKPAQNPQFAPSNAGSADANSSKRQPMPSVRQDPYPVAPAGSNHTAPPQNRMSAGIPAPPPGMRGLNRPSLPVQIAQHQALQAHNQLGRGAQYPTHPSASQAISMQPGARRH